MYLAPCLGCWGRRSLNTGCVIPRPIGALVLLTQPPGAIVEAPFFSLTNSWNMVTLRLCWLLRPQALAVPWSEFLRRIPGCESLRGFIEVHDAYLDAILER